MRAALPVPLPPPWEPPQPQGPPRRRRPGGIPPPAGRALGALVERVPLAEPDLPAPAPAARPAGNGNREKGPRERGGLPARSSRPQPGEDRQFQGLAGAPTCEQEASEASERQGAARPPQEGPGRRAREGGRAD